eukprot:gene5027-7016_t
MDVLIDVEFQPRNSLEKVISNLQHISHSESFESKSECVIGKVKFSSAVQCNVFAERHQPNPIGSPSFKYQLSPTITLSDLNETGSFLASEGEQTHKRTRIEDISGSLTAKIDNISSLTEKINSVFGGNYLSWEAKRQHLLNLLDRVDLNTDEINKYTYFDLEKPYTRNLVATDGVHYTLLLLCWSPFKESKIHNHPCDGCIMKTLRGCIKESRYSFCETKNEIVPLNVRFYCEGQTAYIQDSEGLHKVGNPSYSGAVSLHLYSPPFGSCKVWATAGSGQYSNHEIGKVGYYSVLGHRTPQLEGVPGSFSRVLTELLSKTQTLSKDL